MTSETRLARCMGGNFCNHLPGTCTATNSDYQAKAKAAAVIQADREAVRAELVAEIVAWLNVRAGQVLQLHAEAKTDHERNIVDEHASAIEQSAIEIEAKWGKP